MSTEGRALPSTRSALGDARSVAVLRFALGTTLAVALAFGFAWPVGFLTPVLVAKLLGTAGFRPSLRVGTGMLGAMALGLGLGLAIALPLNHYPAVQLLVVGLCLFRIFHFGASGGAPFGVTMLLVGVTVLPLLVLESPGLAVDFSGGFLLLGVAAMALVGLAHGLLPDREGFAAPGPELAAPPPAAAPVEQAVIATAVVLPLLVFVLALKLTSAVLVLAFVAILAQQPGLREGRRAGLALLAGNALGGLAAIVAYELLVAVPTFGFLLVLMLLAALLFGQRIHSADPRAPLWAMGFSTFLILLGSSTAPTGEEAGANFYGRIFQVLLAALYIVAAFAVLEEWSGRTRSRA